MSATIHCGDVRDVLPTLPANSVQCCVTSPPYYALRDYNVAGQIGLEPTLGEYVATMVDVFRDVKRVLRDDGTVWCNVADSYAPDKNLRLMPERLAIALQADGWIVRADILWAKPNPMPESVQDRPTVAHEHIWLLTKQARYFYDADAIREPNSENTHGGLAPNCHKQWAIGGASQMTTLGTQHDGRNKRTVWTVATSPYSERHFATFPPKLIEPCILAGTSERGACPACGAPWRRMVEHVAGDAEAQFRPKRTAGMDSTTSTLSLSGNGSAEWAKRGGATYTTGWQPTCPCDAGDAVPCVVLDPFSGAGTTGVVALRHGRDYIGVELNREYAEMSRRRIYGDAPLLNSVTVEAA